MGSGPDRGRSPVVWGDFPSARTFVCMYVHPPPLPTLRPSQPGLKPEAWLAIRASDLGGTDVRTYRWKIYSFYRTSSPVRAAAQKVNSSKLKKIRNLCNYWLSRHTCIHVKTIFASSAMTKVDVNRKPWVSSKNCKGQPSW